MTVEKGSLPVPEAPRQNFARGLYEAEIPELDSPKKGKVRDSWIIGDKRIMVTTDRQSAFDQVVSLTPGKGQVLNLFSAFWFEQTKDIIPNQMIAIPHPNVIVAKQAEKTLPVEVVLRRYMARSSTSTSIYHNYAERGRREIYGLKFPEGLQPNQEFPMGTILTPTTKAETGHDQELTDEQALEIVDSKLGDGTWKKTKAAAYNIFEQSRAHCMEKGLILVDTKYEFGLDKDGVLMLIDEVNTPDSSRFWKADSYEERFRKGETPETFDKEILRRWLAENGFTGEGQVPVIDPEIIDQMASAYRVPYEMITGKVLSHDSQTSNPDSIRKAILEYLNN